MATTYEVDRQAAAVMALNAKHIMHQCDALLARLAVVYADHYSRQTIEDMVRGCRVLAEYAAITLGIGADLGGEKMVANNGEQIDRSTIVVEPPRDPHYKASGCFIAAKTVSGRQLTDEDLDTLGTRYSDVLYQMSQEARR